MIESRLLKDAAAVIALAERLSNCQEVKRHTTGEHDEPSTLAHALADIEESLESLRLKLLPKLVAEPPDPRRDLQVLLDIGEELRHVLYHIDDSRFFQYLKPGAGEL